MFMEKCNLMMFILDVKKMLTSMSNFFFIIDTSHDLLEDLLNAWISKMFNLYLFKIQKEEGKV